MMAETVLNGRKHVIRVRVRVEHPGTRAPSYVRDTACREADSHLRAGAVSGAFFARSFVDREAFGIEILEISGDFDHPEASNGVAVATAAATLVAYGADWNAQALGDTRGWSIRAPTC
jgi:hypothetical protein